MKNTKEVATVATPAKSSKSVKATTPKVEKAPKAEKVAKAPKVKIEKPAAPVIAILSAQYGIDGTRVEMAKVNFGRKLTNKMAGTDPAPKLAKNAIISISVDGAPAIEKTFAEGEQIVF